MYTFQPLASIPVDHFGCGLVVGFCVFWLIIAMFNEPETFFAYFFIATIACGIAYGVSYHWTNQTPQTFANTPVVGEFQMYVPEGYNESRTSGKSTRRVDVHNLYVVYRVNGDPVVFNAQAGVAYPKTAILYKN